MHSNSPPPILKLDNNTANQIAAGEVIERPSAVVKELVENAIDAQATKISIRIKNGGKTLIEVSDNGHGISANELRLAIERHATSKLTNLFEISSFGFRGEALPSIGAVARLEISSKREGQEAHKIEVSGGEISDTTPARRNSGTTVRVSDLFFATPARLKFLGSDRAENIAIADTIKRLAMANPDIGFDFFDISGDKARKILNVSPSGLRERLTDILGQSKLDDCISIDTENEGIRLSGFIGLPTAAQGSASGQYFFVNARPVRDKLFFGAVKGAYSDLLPKGKFPFIVLFMNIAPKEIDVNVHPAKSEIRFQKAPAIRSFVLNAIRHSLAQAGLRTDTALSQSFSAGFQDQTTRPSTQYQHFQTRAFSTSIQDNTSPQPAFQEFAEAPRAFEPMPEVHAETQDSFPLGIARAQYHKNYIISETNDGLIIVDQHAAHERLVYEKLKTQYAQNGVKSQRLLIPEIINLGAIEKLKIVENKDWLTEIGIEIELFGEDAIAIHSLPALLSHAAPIEIINTLVDALDADPKAALQKRIHEVLATIACHGSVRSGRKLNSDEMNALLREMEATPNSGTCNHGRPTFIKLDLNFLESKFGR